MSATDLSTTNSAPITNSASKSAMRRDLRSARRTLTSAQQQQHAARLTHNALKTLLTLRFRRFGLYLPADGEIDTWPLINKLLSFGLVVGLPSLRRNATGQLQMRFVRFTQHTPLLRGHYGLLEPHPSAQERTTDARRSFVPDVLFTPLVGFDNRGNRLGMGGGFYDRYKNSLEGIKPALRVGLAHELQGLPKTRSLPADPWDKPLDGVITEQNVRGFSARGAHCLT